MDTVRTKQQIELAELRERQRAQLLAIEDYIVRPSAAEPIELDPPQVADKTACELRLRRLADDALDDEGRAYIEARAEHRLIKDLRELTGRLCGPNESLYAEAVYNRLGTTSTPPDAVDLTPEVASGMRAFIGATLLADELAGDYTDPRRIVEAPT